MLEHISMTTHNSVTYRERQRHTFSESSTPPPPRDAGQRVKQEYKCRQSLKISLLQEVLLS